MYCQKYLKYKNKYLKLKNLIQKKQYGSGPVLVRNFQNINLFTNSQMEEMEKLMNPIYGYFLYHSGFMVNNYFLKTQISPIVKRVVQSIDNIIYPTNKIKELTPLDLGRFIAIQYVFLINKEIQIKYKMIFKKENGVRIL